MNLPSSKTVKSFTKIALFVAASFVNVSVKAWEVDLSRRKKDLVNSRMPASVQDEVNKPEVDLTTKLFESVDPTQEIVIMNTEKGFVPETVRLKKGQNYKVHVVNVNDKEKNTSFILDAFSEHHATYYGQEKYFSLSPKVDGIFSFQCPETAKQGRFVIYSDADSDRKPAGQ